MPDTVLVTGATGFIGRHLVLDLVAAGYEVRCLVRRPEAAGALTRAGAALIPGDVMDRPSVERALRGCTGAFHLAARYEVGLDPAAGQRLVDDNLASTRNVLEAAAEAGVRTVYTSSCTVYVNTGGAVVDEDWRYPPGPFPSAYVASKHRAHREVFEPLAANGAPLLAVLPGAVLGPGDTSAFNLIFEWLAAGIPLFVGSSRWAMVGVRDCARAHRLAYERGRIGRCYNVVSENLSLVEAARLARQASGVRTPIVPLPDSLLALQLPLVRLLERVLPVPRVFSSESLSNQFGTLSQTMSGRRAQEELGFAPAPMGPLLGEVVVDEIDRRRAPRP